jgi:DNA-binding CsgD family transcriptional regulator
MPHLIRSLQLHTRLSTVENKCSAFATAFDRIQGAFILLDAMGQIIFLNRAAQAIVDRKDGLAINSRKLRAQSSSENALLKRTISDTAVLACGKTTGQPGSTTVSRPNRGSSYYLTMSPVRPAVFTGLEDPAVAVFIADPNDAIRTPDTRLKGLFGLTKAEARLSQLLVGGMELREAAEQIGVSYNTVRMQLRGVLAKTGTSRQSELMRVLTLVGLGGRD